MTGALHPVSRGRLLAITPRRGVGKVLAEQKGRPVVALLTSHDTARDPADLEPVILALLDGGCDYFVCFGIASENLHDRIDDFALEHTSASDRTIMTTWHDEEPAEEVIEFFFNVAAASEKTLLVAVLESNDAELATMLIRKTST